MRSRRPVVVIVVAALAVAAAYSWWALAAEVVGLAPGAALHARVNITLDWVVPLAAAIVMATVAVRRRGADRWVWALFAAGTACWAAGSMTWAAYVFTDATMGDPGPADIFYLAMPALWVAGLLVRAADRRHGEAGPGVIDGLLAASATLLLLWLGLRQLSAISEASGATVVDLAYPVGDALVLTLLGRALARRDDRDRGVLAALTVGWACIGLGDLIYLLLNAWGLDNGGASVLDAPWTVGFAVLCGAAVLARRTDGGTAPTVVAPTRAVARRGPRSTVPIVYATVAVLVGMLDVSVRRDGPPWTVPIVIVVVMLLLLRQVLTLGENRRLSADLVSSVDRLRHQAAHDRLTGLPNRSLVVPRLDALVEHTATEGWAAVAFVDIDHLKAINDSLGHGRGDELIRTVARRLSSRDGDEVARFGGDEFVVLLAGGDQDVATEASSLVERVSGPVDLGGPVVQPSVSVGVALVEPGAGADELLRRADTALYRAKASGRRQAVLYDRSMDADSRRLVELGPDLRRALAEGEFEVHYQPVVDLQTGRVDGAEALLRWRHPTDGLLAPDAFLDDADALGLLARIGDRTLREATRRFAEVNARPGQAPIRVAVNLSASELATGDAVDRVASALTESGLEPALLVLEIREDVVVDDSTRRTIDGLRGLGVGIAIDDFGTGNSSLRQLGSYPATVLKVDRSFVDGLGTEAEDTFIVRAIVNLARNLGMRTVAEGVETAEQRRLLQEMGCDFAQGWWYDRALPFDRFDAIHVGGRSERRLRAVT